MLPPYEFAELVFDVLRFSIDLSCSERDWRNVKHDALAFGFTETDVSTTFAYAQRFDLVIEPDIYLCLHYRSFDPSGPFHTLSAVSKFELTMTFGEDQVKAYQNSFDEVATLTEPVAWHELSFT